jgi:hypothetical protein
MTNFRHLSVTVKHIHSYRRRQRIKTIGYRIFQVTQYIVITGAALVMAFNGYYGQYIIVAYGLVIILPKLWPFSYGKMENLIDSLSSQQVFIIAILILGSIPLFTILGKGVIAQNAAIYVFELLVVGVFAATIELWRDNRHNEHSLGLPTS